MHAAFAVGVLTEILNKLNEFDELKGSGKPRDLRACRVERRVRRRLSLVTSGLAGRRRSGSADKAIEALDRVWNAFTAGTPSETILNGLAYYAFRLQEAEAPVLGLNRRHARHQSRQHRQQDGHPVVADLDVRKQYFDLHDYLKTACPEFELVELAQCANAPADRRHGNRSRPRRPCSTPP